MKLKERAKQNAKVYYVLLYIYYLLKETPFFFHAFFTGKLFVKFRQYRIIRFCFPAIRGAMCASKQLLYFWLHHDIPKYSQGLVSLDIGCGPFGFYHLFRCQEYVGIDVEPQQLGGLKRDSGDSKAFDYFVNNDFLKMTDAYGDFVLCVQVFTSQNFSATDTISAVDKLIEMTHIGGTLIFNTARSSVPYEPEFEKTLRKNFKRVKIRRYGAWSYANKDIKPRVFFVPFLAGLMWAIPWLRHRRHHTKSYYVCEGKCKP